jgi:hypothetical protein
MSSEQDRRLIEDYLPISEVKSLYRESLGSAGSALAQIKEDPRPSLSARTP